MTEQNKDLFPTAPPAEQLNEEVADDTPSPSDLQPHVQILEKGAFAISIPEVSLERGASLDAIITLQKEVTPVTPEAPREDELPVVREMLHAARALRGIPEHERPRKIMELLRSRVMYPSKSAIAELETSDPQLAADIKKECATPGFIQTSTLRRIAQLGYGICGPLSASMLILGKEAGLEGAFLGNGLGKESPNPIKNIVRLDNGKPLFKADQNYGQSIPDAHAWVEFKLSDGTWLPVDPSTQLVGDTQAGLDTFNAASYRAEVGRALKLALPEGLACAKDARDLEFLPSEDCHTGVLKIKPTNERYAGPVDMTLKSHKAPVAFPAGVRYEVVAVSL